MDDSTFNDQFKAIHVPSEFAAAKELQDKVVFALADLNEATADAVSRKLEELEPETGDKVLIAGAHRILTELHEKGLIKAVELNGDLIYSLPG